MQNSFPYEIVTNVRLGGGTGRRTGLKIRSPERGVRVRFPPQALVFSFLPASLSRQNGKIQKRHGSRNVKCKKA